MATTRDAFAAYCVELLGALGSARSRRMFGGHGLYVDDLFVALVIGGQLYLKVDAETRPRFEAASCRPFVYGKADQRVALSYWSAPDAATESPAAMLPWARLAQAAALRARATKPPRTTRSATAKHRVVSPRGSRTP